MTYAASRNNALRISEKLSMTYRPSNNDRESSPITARVTRGMTAPSRTNPVSEAVIHLRVCSNIRSVANTMLMPTISTSSGASACQSIAGRTKSSACARSDARSDASMSVNTLRCERLSASEGAARCGLRGRETQ